MTKSKMNWLHMALLVCVALILYGQSVRFDYVWDDGIIFLDKNSLVVEPLSWALLTQPVLEGTSYMRPMVMLTWFLEFHLFGQNPGVSHAVNVFFFCINVVLVRTLALQMLRRTASTERPEFWALIAGLMYAVHPVLIESTAWVAGRFDLMCTTFIVAASVSFLHERWATAARVTGVVVFTVCALLCKELGLITPMILVCLWMATQASQSESLIRNLRTAAVKEWPVWLALVLTIALYFVVRRASMGTVYHSQVSADYLWVALVMGLLPLEALKTYMGLAVLPFGKIGIFHPLSAIEFGSLSFFIGNASVLLLTIVVVWMALVRQRSWAWLLMAAYVGIALVLHLIPMTISDNVAQDRFMATPLVFVVIALVLFPWRQLVGERLRLRPFAQKVSATLLLGGWIAFAAFSSLTLIPLWENPLTLWRWASVQNPDVGAIRHNYMHAALLLNRPDLVEAEMNRLMTKNKGLEVGEQILYGNFLTRKGDPEAIRYIEGVMYALPKFHEMEDGRERIKGIPLSSLQMAGSYIDYSNAQLLFKGDAEAALKLNDAAAWYLKPSEQGTLKYQRAAILYSLGRIQEADDLVEKSDSVYYFGQDRMKIGMRNVVSLYCLKQTERSGAEPAPCKELKARHFFDAP